MGLVTGRSVAFGVAADLSPLAVAAIVLARLDKRLWLGAIFVALPSANLLLGVIIFTIAILIYGF